MPDRVIRFRFDDIRETHAIPSAKNGSTMRFARMEARVNQYKRYEIINYVAAVAHLVQCIWMIFPENAANVPIKERYLDWVESAECAPNATVQTNGFSLIPKVHETHTISIKWLIVAFHGLSFVFELAATDPCFGYTTYKRFARWRANYQQRVKQGTNYLRFVEYSASASVMMIAIALISGIWDSYSLIGIGFLTFATMVFGGIAEQLYSDVIPATERANNTSNIRTNEAPDKGFTASNYPLTYNMRRLAWFSHFAGWFTMMSAYGIILRNFVFSNDNSQEKAPGFVYWIVFAIFALYNGFGLIQLVQLCRKTRIGKLFNPLSTNTRGYSRLVKSDNSNETEPNAEPTLGKLDNSIWNEKVEMAYVVNSLVSKTLLGVLLYGNVLMAERTKC